VPNARMDETGTIRAQISHLDPYLHGFIGIQIADPLYIGIRQSAEVSSFDENFDRLYPGIDAKLRIVKEKAHTPEISLGVQSGLGHKRQSGEYIVASKRYKSFDVSGGIGWGRFASAAHIDNPLKAFGSHFDKNRGLDGENPTKPQNWFTGQNIGFFAGLEYFTPLKGLSLKADYGGDQYEAEKSAFNFQPASPWSIGLNYKPWGFVDFGIAAQGTDKVMARLSLQGNVKNWKHQSAYNRNHTIESPITNAPYTASTTLPLSKHHSSPLQIGKTASYVIENTEPSAKSIIITPSAYNLRGPSIHLMRPSLENALNNNNGSTDEIWHASEIKHGFSGLQNLKPYSANSFGFKNVSFILDNHISLAEEDTSLLRRTSLVASIIKPDTLKYFTSGLGLRLNLSDNIGKLRRTRARSSFPIKSDVADFADRTFALDTGFTALTHTIAPDTHGSIIAGYVDENFTGVGTEILYRPFDKRYAIGGEMWAVQKRDPFTTFNLGTRDGTLVTAHVNGWYDIPKADTTIGIKAGRYLAKDIGASLNLTKNFKNGASLEGYVSVSDKADFDLFGGTTHADHGLRLTLPLGGFKYTPNAKIRVTAAPFGRDIGQFVGNPLPLYKATNQFSLAHISKHWDELND